MVGCGTPLVVPSSWAPGRIIHVVIARAGMLLGVWLHMLSFVGCCGGGACCASCHARVSHAAVLQALGGSLVRAKRSLASCVGWARPVRFVDVL